MASFNSYSQQHQQQPQPPPQPQPQPQQHHHHLHHHQHHHQFVPNPNEAAPSMGHTTATATSTLATSTLLVRHLPEAIPHDMLSLLFSHYGASAVRPCAGGKIRNCAFVDFSDEALASQAQAQMNRLRFLGKVLAVERVGGNSKPSNRDMDSQSEPRPKDTPAPPPLLLNDPSKQNNSIYGAEPIAPRLGLDYPFPPHLEYAYPPPDGNILSNIVSSLIAVPRFYTQVLHLMNKMNLQPPFRMALPTPPLPAPVPQPPPPPPPPPVAVEPLHADLSSEESELESSEDDASNNHSRKRVKREAIVGPAIDKDVAHEAVGLKPVSLVPKEVPVIKKKNPVLQIKIAPRPTQKVNIDDMNELTEPVKEQVEQKPYATPEDIKKMKLPPEDILSLPKFKNYTSGNPAKVLYIKNLAKDVVIDDFYFIFGSLFESVEAARSGLSIKLMKEGRMRGQAFVTFPSIDLAQHALNLVNGYEFKGKPMIIHFGHNPSASKTT